MRPQHSSKNMSDPDRIITAEATNEDTAVDDSIRPRLLADFIGQPERTGDLPVDEDVQDDRTLLPPGVRDRQLLATGLLEQVRSAHLHDLAVDVRADTDRG